MCHYEETLATIISAGIIIFTTISLPQWRCRSTVDAGDVGQSDGILRGASTRGLSAQHAQAAPGHAWIQRGLEQAKKEMKSNGKMRWVVLDGLWIIFLPRSQSVDSISGTGTSIPTGISGIKSQ